MKKLAIKILIGAIVLVVAAVISFQFAWGSDRFLPGSVILGVDVSGKTIPEVRDQLATLLEGHHLIIMSESSEQIASTDISLDQISLDETLYRDVTYPAILRLLPGSLWLRGKFVSTDKLPVYVDGQAIIESIATEPREGSIFVSNEAKEERLPVTGFDYDVDHLRRLLAEAQIGTADEVITIATTPKQPQVSAAHLSEKFIELTALREQVLDNFRGSSLGVMAVDLDGYWSLGLNENRVYTSASTYKLFVAYSMLKAVQDGRASWSDRLSGTTLEKCLETMIVDSDNACPEAWNLKQGYSKVNAEVKAIGGLDNTKVGYGDMRTTAHDLATFLGKLYRGELLDDWSTSTLIDLMKRQTYRDGIPAGVSAPVADKVGFLSGLLHDAAIVYDPEQPYLLVIMTQGSSWQNIARLASDIDAYNW